MTLSLFKQIGLRHLLVALSLAPGLAIAHGISDADKQRMLDGCGTTKHSIDASSWRWSC